MPAKIGRYAKNDTDKHAIYDKYSRKTDKGARGQEEKT